MFFPIQLSIQMKLEYLFFIFSSSTHTNSIHITSTLDISIGYYGRYKRIFPPHILHLESDQGYEQKYKQVVGFIEVNRKIFSY